MRKATNVRKAFAYFGSASASIEIYWPGYTIQNTGSFKDTLSQIKSLVGKNVMDFEKLDLCL